MKYSIERKAVMNEYKALKRRFDQVTKQLSELAKQSDIALLAARAKRLMPLTEEEARLAQIKTPQAKYAELVISAVGGSIMGSAILPSLINVDAGVGGTVGTILGIMMFYAFVRE